MLGPAEAPFAVGRRQAAVRIAEEGSDALHLGPTGAHVPDGSAPNQCASSAESVLWMMATGFRDVTLERLDRSLEHDRLRDLLACDVVAPSVSRWLKNSRAETCRPPGAARAHLHTSQPFLSKRALDYCGDGTLRTSGHRGGRRALPRQPPRTPQARAFSTVLRRRSTFAANGAALFLRGHRCS
jgi:hypothetical protein